MIYLQKTKYEIFIITWYIVVYKYERRILNVFNLRVVIFNFFSRSKKS